MTTPQQLRGHIPTFPSRTNELLHEAANTIEIIQADNAALVAERDEAQEVMINALEAHHQAFLLLDRAAARIPATSEEWHEIQALIKEQSLQLSQ